jgi:hypothetical protein
MKKFAIRLLTLAVLSLTLAAAPVVTAATNKRTLVAAG